MCVSAKFLSVLTSLLLAGVVLTSSSTARAEEPATGTPAASKRLQAIFQSLKEDGDQNDFDINWTPVLVAILAVGLGTYAINQWNRRQSKTPAKALHNHRRLLKIASRRAGLSTSQLKAISPVTQGQGMSSPLVAILCPSTIKGLAQAVKTIEQQEALKALTKTLLKRESVRI